MLEPHAACAAAEQVLPKQRRVAVANPIPAVGDFLVGGQHVFHVTLRRAGEDRVGPVPGVVCILDVLDHAQGLLQAAKVAFDGEVSVVVYAADQLQDQVAAARAPLGDELCTELCQGEARRAIMGEVRINVGAHVESVVVFHACVGLGIFAPFGGIAPAMVHWADERRILSVGLERGFLIAAVERICRGIRGGDGADASLQHADNADDEKQREVRHRRVS
mmetsp:Transcript_34007/g.84067  ORF Transcript_34007/g.84067 Transcript_34007/m.84067 type:complete len:220 (+) Transcript_34007:1244-1903(+)